MWLLLKRAQLDKKEYGLYQYISPQHVHDIAVITSCSTSIWYCSLTTTCNTQYTLYVMCFYGMITNVVIVESISSWIIWGRTKCFLPTWSNNNITNPVTQHNNPTKCLLHNKTKQLVDNPTQNHPWFQSTTAATALLVLLAPLLIRFLLLTTTPSALLVGVIYNIAPTLSYPSTIHICNATTLMNNTRQNIPTTVHHHVLQFQRQNTNQQPEQQAPNKQKRQNHFLLETVRQKQS